MSIQSANTPISGFAYQFRISVDLSTILKYRLEGGSPVHPKIDMHRSDGVFVRGRSIDGCFMFSDRIPDELTTSVPKTLVVLNKNTNRLPDFGYDNTFSCFIVSERVKTAIEELEPNTHQFLAIARTVDGRGTALPNRNYYLMNVLATLAPFDISSSTVVVKQTDYGTTMLKVAPGPQNSWAFVADRNAIGSHHLWRGNEMGLMGNYFCSQALRSRFDERSIVGIDYVKTLA